MTRCRAERRGARAGSGVASQQGRDLGDRLPVAGHVPAVAVGLDDLGRAAGREHERRRRAASPTAASRPASTRPSRPPATAASSTDPTRASAPWPRPAARAAAGGAASRRAASSGAGRSQRHARPAAGRPAARPARRCTWSRASGPPTHSSPAVGLVDRAERRASPAFVQRHRRAPDRQAGQEVVGAVDRVDVPGAAPPAVVGGALLADDARRPGARAAAGRRRAPRPRGRRPRRRRRSTSCARRSGPRAACGRRARRRRARASAASVEVVHRPDRTGPEPVQPDAGHAP